MSSVPLDVEIADITCRFELRGPGLAENAAVRYGEFLSDNEPDMTVEAAIDHTLSGGDPFPVGIVRENGRLRAKSYNFDAKISLQDRSAQATVSSEWEALDALLRVMYSVLLTRHGGVMVHASAVVDKGRGYVFAGLPETGKSTMARMADGRAVVGDELVALRRLGDEVRVYSTPFWNEPELGASTPLSAPVTAILLLEQDSRTYLESLKPLESAVEMFPHLFYEPEQVELNQMALDSLGGILERTRCCRFHFTLDRQEVWRRLEQLT